MFPTVLTHKQIAQIVEAFSEKTKKIFATKKEVKQTKQDLQEYIDSLERENLDLKEEIKELDSRLKEYESIILTIDAPEGEFDWNNYSPKYVPEEDNEEG